VEVVEKDGEAVVYALGRGQLEAQRAGGHGLEAGVLLHTRPVLAEPEAQLQLKVGRGQRLLHGMHHFMDAMGKRGYREDFFFKSDSSSSLGVARKTLNREMDKENRKQKVNSTGGEFGKRFR
jgi:hypothetical protein